MTVNIKSHNFSDEGKCVRCGVTREVSEDAGAEVCTAKGVRLNRFGSGEVPKATGSKDATAYRKKAQRRFI